VRPPLPSCVPEVSKSEPAFRDLGWLWHAASLVQCRDSIRSGWALSLPSSASAPVQHLCQDDSEVAQSRTPQLGHAYGWFCSAAFDPCEGTIQKSRTSFKYFGALIAQQRAANLAGIVARADAVDLKAFRMLALRAEPLAGPTCDAAACDLSSPKAHVRPVSPARPTGHQGGRREGRLELCQ
jgi:hypothetical protein